MDTRMDNAPPFSGSEATLLRQLIMGFRSTQLVHVTARLGLSDHLRQPQTPQELAAKVGANPAVLYRLLRTLSGLGLFEEMPDRRFRVTAVGALLQTDVEGSLRDVAILYGSEWLWRVYGELHDSFQAGHPAFKEVRGQAYYGHLDAHPSAAAQFNAATSVNSRQEAIAILAAYDFADVGSLVDIGGGQGALLAAILQSHPALSGAVLDLKPAIDVAQDTLSAAGVSDRATCVVGDFFKEVPLGADLYLLKSVLHNWSDDDALRILRACRQAMADNCRLLVIERIVPAGNEPSEAKLFDINTSVAAGGRERSKEDYEALFDAADLTLARVIPTNSHLSILEAVPASSADTERALRAQGIEARDRTRRTGQTWKS